jgi:polysaccharide deacetylase family protein (PEP-CTERM system associated)
MTRAMTNLLTVDVEEWYHSSFSETRPTDRDLDASRLDVNVGRLLDLFGRRGARATFFVVGTVAERKPDILRMIRRGGHAVAIHGWDHRLLSGQSREEFARDLDLSIAAIEGVTGVRPRGFRAPSWSMTAETAWAYEVLACRGLEYDSSIYPIRTFLYGMAGAPRFPFHPRMDGRDLPVLEIPASTVQLLGRRWPFAGGAFLRALPSTAIKAGIRRLNAEGFPAVVYCHPWEIDPAERRLPLPAHQRWIQYTGLAGCLPKLDRVLRSFAFASIEEQLDSGALCPEAR